MNRLHQRPMKRVPLAHRSWNMRHAKQSRLSAILGSAALVACIGCGDKGPPRVAVSGNVLLDGAPMSSGSITFTPIAPTSGPLAGGPIVDGKYLLDERNGPVIGKLRVEILADIEFAAPPDDPRAFDAATGGKVPVNPLPAKYNTASELKVETLSGQENEFNFELQSRAGP